MEPLNTTASQQRTDRLNKAEPTRVCVLEADAANRFAALSSFKVTEGLVAGYPRGAFLAPAHTPAEVGGPGMRHVLMMPLNGVTDEWYTVHYSLSGEAQ
eukprot:1175805-Prorocentrum_minimum.AAC.3